MAACKGAEFLGEQDRSWLFVHNPSVGDAELSLAGLRAATTRDLEESR